MVAGKKGIWKKFEGPGDEPISVAELKILLKETRSALPYLESRGDIYGLAFLHAARTELEIVSRLEAKKEFK